MQRRKFITATLAATATGALAANTSSTTKPFVVKKGEARFGIHTPYRGINPNDTKISGKDTNGQLAVFEYIGNEKIGPASKRLAQYSPRTRLLRLPTFGS